MADAVQTYAIVAGVFVFLTALLFATRARKPRAQEAQQGGSGSSATGLQ